MNFAHFLHGPLFHATATLLVAVLVQILSGPVINFVVRRTVVPTRGETKLDAKKRANTISAVIRTTFTALLAIAVICSILATFGVNVAALLTGAGIIGVFVGLSAQNTVRDLLAGLFIVLEKQYRVGDTIALSGGTTGADGVSGKVEEITLRITRLRDLGGNAITIRNGDPSVIVNKTFSDASIVLDFSVTYDSDIKAVERIINAVGADLASDQTWSEVIRRPITFLRVDNFNEAGVVVRAVGVTAPASQWDIAGEYRKRLLSAVAKDDNVTFAHS